MRKWVTVRPFRTRKLEKTKTIICKTCFTMLTIDYDDTFSKICPVCKREWSDENGSNIYRKRSSNSI